MSNTYESIDFTPPRKVADNAQKALEMHDEFSLGSTELGYARACDLKDRKPLSPEAVNRMCNYFNHQTQYDEKHSSYNKGAPSASYITWMLWGGKEGRDWAGKIKIQMQELNQKSAA